MINYPMQYEMEQQIVDLIAEIEALKREKNHYIQEWSDVCDENQGLRNEIETLKSRLADVIAERDEDAEAMFRAIAAASASQAREKVLRDSLEKIADWDSLWGPFPEKNEAWRAMVVVIAREAVPLAQPTDDSALKAALSVERERCCRVCVDINEQFFNESGEKQAVALCIDAIRALGGE